MKKTKANAGETIVEVMASVFIFVIMIGILQGAISYATAMQEKNKQIRKENVEIIKAFNEETDITSLQDYTFDFVATNSNMNALGNQVFTIKAKLNTKQVHYQDTNNQQKDMTFYLYGVSGGNDNE